MNPTTKRRPVRREDVAFRDPNTRTMYVVGVQKANTMQEPYLVSLFVVDPLTTSRGVVLLKVSPATVLHHFTHRPKCRAAYLAAYVTAVNALKHGRPLAGPDYVNTPDNPTSGRTGNRNR